MSCRYPATSLMLLKVIIISAHIYFNNADATGQFECGSHGRFEYCIDGIPGCVIGCHCHPGYYFDSDTKICEPNSKLISESRRVQQRRLTTEPVIETTKDTEYEKKFQTEVLNSKVDTITKDADDLSDWLYNQFFKAIENQVINNTDNVEVIKSRRNNKNDNVEVGALTRRKRRKHSKSKLRKSLLRISEDDSLFDSSSSSNSDSGDSSDSSGDDSGRPWQGGGGGGDKKDHNHRKILMIHKKPKPPLPSFVFLPDSGTPFFPPVQLPAPPLPMFPNVPVPPMYPAPVFFYTPCPQQNGTNEVLTTGTNAPSTKAATTTDAATKDKQTASDTKQTVTITSTPEPDATDPSKTDGPTENNETAPGDSSKPTDAPPEGETEEKPPQSQRQRRPPNRHSPRSRPAPKAKEKNKSKPPKTPRNKNVQQNKLNFMPDIEESMSESDIMFLKEMYRTPTPSSSTTEENRNDVKFEYLADLIHRINPQNSPGINSKPNIISNKMAPLNNNYNGNARENLQFVLSNNNRPKSIAHQDENYYINLGKEIASLVRGIDNDGQRQVDIEVQPTSDRYTSDPPLNNANRYATGSFWERFVRSPSSTKLKQFIDYDPIILRENNEQLHKLENIVKNTATTEPILSLVELESIIKVMEKSNVFKGENVTQRKNKPQTNKVNVNFFPRTHLQPTVESYHYESATTTENTFEYKPSYHTFNKPTTKQENIDTQPEIFKVDLEPNKLKTYPIDKPFLNYFNGVNSKLTPPRNRLINLVPQRKNIPKDLGTNSKYFASPMVINYKKLKYFSNDNDVRDNIQYQSPLTNTIHEHDDQVFYRQDYKTSYFNDNFNSFDFFQ